MEPGEDSACFGGTWAADSVDFSVATLDAAVGFAAGISMAGIDSDIVLHDSYSGSL